MDRSRIFQRRRRRSRSSMLSLWIIFIRMVRKGSVGQAHFLGIHTVLSPHPYSQRGSIVLYCSSSNDSLPINSVLHLSLFREIFNLGYRRNIRRKSLLNDYNTIQSTIPHTLKHIIDILPSISPPPVIKLQPSLLVISQKHNNSNC